MQSTEGNRDMSVEGIEAFINDYLKEDLRELEKHLNSINSEIIDYMQLKNTVKTMQEHLAKGFKTQVNIGGNFFMQAKVQDPSKILIDIGLHTFVEFTLDEALKFIEVKIRILQKEADVIREESIKKRADIKLGLLCIGEQQKLYGTERK